MFTNESTSYRSGILLQITCFSNKIGSLISLASSEIFGRTGSFYSVIEVCNWPFVRQHDSRAELEKHLLGTGYFSFHVGVTPIRVSMIMPYTVPGYNTPIE